jgi:predicted AlkP superfamily pyrophosphatase or phosphodiesterase
MTHEYAMTAIAPTVAAALGWPAPQAASTSPIAPILADLTGAARVAIVAPDALGLAPFDHWRTEMPFLAARHAEQSLLLRAIMPTITPVNFAAMVTGAVRDVHGVGAFTDSFACETLFDVARAQGATSAGIGRQGWTGSELLGRHADYWGKAESHTDAEVESIALEIASDKLPEFLIVQVGNTDEVFHRHGPSSDLVIPALREMDARLRRLTEGLLALGYSVLLHADHGQHDTATGGSHGTDSDEDALVPGTWVAP